MSWATRSRLAAGNGTSRTLHRFLGLPATGAYPFGLWDTDPRILWLMAAGPGDDLDAPIPRGPAWQRHAACLGKPTEWWFPEGRGSGPSKALEVCEGCPVRVRCAEWAIAEGLDVGVFAGMLREVADAIEDNADGRQ